MKDAQAQLPVNSNKLHVGSMCTKGESEMSGRAAATPSKLRSVLC